MHRDKTGPCLAEPSREQHLFTEGAGPEAVMPDPDVTGVVFFHEPGIFKPQVKGPGCAAKKHGDCLGRELIHRAHLPAAIKLPPKGIDGLEQPATIIENLRGEIQCHVCHARIHSLVPVLAENLSCSLRAPAYLARKRAVGLSKRAGPGALVETMELLRILPINLDLVQGDVGGQPGVRMVRSTQT